MQLANAAATFALMIVVLTIVEFRETRFVNDTAPVRLTALVMDTSSAANPNTTVDINIERWSSEDERRLVAATFLRQGPAELAGTLRQLKRVGYLRLPSMLGYDLHFARQVLLEDGGRRIRIATDRRIGLIDANGHSPSREYPYALIEIRLGRDGTGEGKMAAFSELSVNAWQETVELEHYASEPVRLQHVRYELQ